MKTTEETQVKSQDWVFAFFLVLAVFTGLNYLMKNMYLGIAKFFVSIDLFLVHYINMFFLSFNIKIEYLQKMDVYYKYQDKGLFDNLKYVLNVGDTIELKVYNFFNKKTYTYFQDVFQDFYFLNILLIMIVFGVFFKLVHRKQNLDGTKIYNKALLAYYDSIIKTPVRKGIGKKKLIVTNDHQPAALSHNGESNYINDSIKLTLLNNNETFWTEVKKSQSKEENIKNKKMKNEKILEKEELLKIDIEKLKDAENIKKYYSLPPQYNKKRLMDVEKEIEKKRKELNYNDAELKLTEVEKEIRKYIDIEKKKTKTPEEERFLKITKQSYERNIEDYNKNYDEGVFLTPKYYILHPKNSDIEGEKGPKFYKTPGIKIIVELLYKYILDSYEPEIKKQIEELKAINKKLNTKNEYEAKTYELNMQIIAEFERQLDENDKKSRVNTLISLSERHKYEETYVLAMWEYANTITNLPTGPLVKLKWENPVLWYAFTSLKRPSIFKMGTPIYVMFLYEKEVEMEDVKSDTEELSEDANVNELYHEEIKEIEKEE